MKYQAKPATAEAFRIVSVAEKPNADLSLNVATDDRENRVATRRMQARFPRNVAPGDYWVVQPNGLVHLSPKDTFEREFEPAGA